jgi:hypothetical protein
MAIFSQHHVDGMDLALSPLASMQRTYPGVKVMARHYVHLGLVACMYMRTVRKVYYRPLIIVFWWGR